jgi:predicted peroxiredoxin
MHMSRKFLFTISNATKNPMEVIGIYKIVSNMKAFEDDAEIVIFLLGEGVQLAKKGVAETINMEMEGKPVNIGELQEMVIELGVKFYVCSAFMPGFGVSADSLIEGFEEKSSAYLGEMLLDGYIPFSLSI